MLMAALQAQQALAEFYALFATVGDLSAALCPNRTLRLLRVALGNLPATLPLLQAAATDSSDSHGAHAEHNAAAGPSSSGSAGEGSDVSDSGHHCPPAATWQPWELCRMSLENAKGLTAGASSCMGSRAASAAACGRQQSSFWQPCRSSGPKQCQLTPLQLCMV